MKKTPRTTTAVRFPDALHARLKKAADERTISMNLIVNRAVEDYLDRLIPIGEFSYTTKPLPTAPPVAVEDLMASLQASVAAAKAARRERS